MKHIVVVGGSYGGVACVNELQKHISKDANVAITLIEKYVAPYIFFFSVLCKSILPE